MNIGLLYTPVSIYQMTRGALVLFVGILSVLFLKRRLLIHQWFALTVVVLGVAIVGLSGSLTKQAIASPAEPGKLVGRGEDKASDDVAVVVGVLFVLFAQIGYVGTRFRLLLPFQPPDLTPSIGQPSNLCWKRRSWPHIPSPPSRQ